MLLMFNREQQKIDALKWEKSLIENDLRYGFKGELDDIDKDLLRELDRINAEISNLENK